MPTKPQIERRQAVVDDLNSHPDGVTAKNLAKRVGVHYTTANDVLHQLKHEGLVDYSGEYDRPRVWKRIDIIPG